MDLVFSSMLSFLVFPVLFLWFLLSLFSVESEISTGTTFALLLRRDFRLFALFSKRAFAAATASLIEEDGVEGCFFSGGVRWWVVCVVEVLSVLLFLVFITFVDILLLPIFPMIFFFVFLSTLEDTVLLVDITSLFGKKDSSSLLRGDINDEEIVDSICGKNWLSSSVPVSSCKEFPFSSSVDSNCSLLIRWEISLLCNIPTFLLVLSVWTKVLIELSGCCEHSIAKSRPKLSLMNVFFRLRLMLIGQWSLHPSPWSGQSQGTSSNACFFASSVVT